MKDPEKSLATARTWQPLMCLGLLAAIGFSALVLETAVHSEALGRWLDRKRVEAHTPIGYERQFLDTEDRVALKDIPDLDPSSGGVYFFGASNIKYGMRVPDLPSEQRRLVHNLGAGEGAIHFERQFTQYLVRSKDILAAGPQKTLIVYATTFTDVRPAVDGQIIRFPNLWRRYGLYRYDLQRGIEPIARGPVWDAYALERARCTSFVQGSMLQAVLLFVPKSLRSWKYDKNPAVLVADYERLMHSDWKENIRRHRRELQDWIDELRSQGIAFQIVLLPLATWHRATPYPAEYRAMMGEVCAAKHVPLIDYSNLLTDDDFIDYSHVNVQGMEKQDPALMDIARKFLQAKGVWPATVPVR